MKYCFQVYLKNNLKPIHVVSENIQLAIIELNLNNIRPDSVQTILNLGEAL
jgi:hypothetical protein